MATIRKSIGDVRRKLVHPDEDSLSDGVIAETLVEVTDELVTELNQTGQAWFICDAIIDVSAGEDSYPLASVAPGFSKARNVWTMDDSDTEHRRRPVEIVSYDELTRYYGGGDPGQSQMEHSAAACAFIYDNEAGDNKIVFAPIPSQTAQYKVIYEPNVVRAQSKDGVAFRLDQFDGYVASLAAMRCLAHCQWTTLKDDDKAIARRIATIQGVEGAQIERGDELFRRFKKSNRNKERTQVRRFGRGRW
jgi:hypothetical protein